MHGNMDKMFLLVYGRLNLVISARRADDAVKFENDMLRYRVISESDFIVGSRKSRRRAACHL